MKIHFNDFAKGEFKYISEKYQKNMKRINIGLFSLMLLLIVSYFLVPKLA